MNPYRIYRDEAADALRRQATAATYSSFVAMPFRESFSYRSQKIFQTVIAAAVAEADGRGGLPRSFAPPQRVDRPQGAVVVTEEIVLGILESHIFIADLTLDNPGVVLETGIAFGTKPNRQIVLITQHKLARLHFDLKVNQVIRYRPMRPTSRIADAIYSAAQHYEEQVKRFLIDVRHRLSPHSLAALLHFATIQQENVHYSLEVAPVSWTLHALGSKEAMMPKSRPPYPAEFRARMVELVHAGRTPEDLAREFEPSSQAIRNWVRQADRDTGRRSDGVTTIEREELSRLRRENRQLKLEREILAKAAAWFARETGSIPPGSSNS